MLADILATPPATRHGLPCSVAVALDALDSRTRTELEAAINKQVMSNGRIWTDAALHTFLAEQGFDVKLSTLGTHRRRTCRCAR